MNPDWALATNGNLAVPHTFRPDIKSLGWFDDYEIDGMVGEYPKYVQAARDDYKIMYEITEMEGKGPFELRMISIEAFWKQSRHRFPFLARLVRYCYTILPSSAMSERVFSMLKQAFSLLQLKTTLNDYVEGVIMLRFNKKFIQAYPEWNAWAPIIAEQALQQAFNP